MTNNLSIRVRFAPSPTGSLHLGGARTALFNYLFAKHHNGEFLLRIEDTDVQRSSAEMTDQILRSLQWLGLQWDGEIFHQSAHRNRHIAICQELIKTKHAYPCFCMTEILEEKRQKNRNAGFAQYDRTCLQLDNTEVQKRIADNQPYAIRFRIPEGQTEFEDLIHGHTIFQNEEIDDFVILRSDGTPVYQIAVVSDDHEMGITHVIRGDDHLSNTPKQILLYKALSWSVPYFAHVPLIWGPDKKRLSKRHGAVSVEAYREQGILAEALVNYLALLGWSPGMDEEIMPLNSLIQKFSLQAVSKKPAVFDAQKLEWMNGITIRSKPAAEFVPLVQKQLQNDEIVQQEDTSFTEDYITHFVRLMQERVKNVREFAQSGKYFFIDPDQYDPDAVKRHFSKEEVADCLEQLVQRLSALKDWDEEGIECAIRDLAKQMEMGAGKIIHPVRVSLTGSAISPGLFEMMALLGRETVERRLLQAIIFIKERKR